MRRKIFLNYLITKKLL